MFFDEFLVLSRFLTQNRPHGFAVPNIKLGGFAVPNIKLSGFAVPNIKLGGFAVPNIKLACKARRALLRKAL